jgi:type II secretory pathway component PulJ
VRADAHRLAGEAGTTISELVIGMAIFSVVIAISLGGLTTAQNTVGRADLRSRSNDQAVLGVNQIARQVRSGNILYDPALENSPGNGILPGLALRIYTQANGIQRCVQWRITSGALQSRSWSESWQLDGQISGWETVAANVVNTTQLPAFSLDSGSSFGGRLLNIDLRVSANPASVPTVQTKQSVTGRNTEYGYDPNVCSSIPPY